MAAGFAVPPDFVGAAVGFAGAGVGLAVGAGLAVGVGLAGGVGGGVVCCAKVRVEAATVVETTTASTTRNDGLTMRLPSEPGVSGTRDTLEPKQMEETVYSRPLMPLSPGTRLGPYEIIGSIGSGGMGEVYRARDTKLNRYVAIKVLPDLLARDPGRLQRLQREAQLLASLNHPHIATIHGLEESGGTCAVVMELVEGDDLKQRIARGSMPLAEALAVARQIADALEAAHAQGIVHRDLKPANIKLRADGAVKVLDFGLAKAMEPSSSSSAVDESPTITSPVAMTEPGVLLGTAAYMSPEQARGKAVDKRADIWAFGCVLYELLAGRSVFRGETVSDTIASVLEREPAWGVLPAETPPGVRRLLQRCLQKDPKRRLHDIADARIEIEDAQSGLREDGPIATPRVGSRSRRVWMSAVALVALIVAGSVGWLVHSAPAAPETRLEINTAPTSDASFAISPDGRTVAFVVRFGGKGQLWLRSLDSSSPRALAGTDGATRPFWSPDGRSIGFFAGVSLKRVDVDGGSVQKLTSNSAVPIGGTWNRDGTILFSDNPGGSILRISARGGDVTPVTKLEVTQRGHYAPLFLPDGRHFLFYVGGSPEAQGAYFGDLGGSAPKRLLATDGAAVYTSEGFLLFIRGNELYAQRFDATRGELSGDLLTVDEQVAARTTLSASAAGPIAYRTLSGDSGQRQLVRFDRSGRELEKVVYRDTAALGPALSHDGRRVAVFRYANGNMDLWSVRADPLGVGTTHVRPRRRYQSPVVARRWQRHFRCRPERGPIEPVPEAPQRPARQRATAAHDTRRGVSDGLVGRRTFPPLRLQQSETGGGPLGVAACGRAQALRGRSDRLQRDHGAVLARRRVDRLPVGQERSRGNLSPAVPGSGKRRARLHRGRDAGTLEPQRQRTILCRRG